MRLDRIFYRSRQFWQALYAVPDADDLALAEGILSPKQMVLFTRLQTGEQAHSLLVFKRVFVQCQLDPVESQTDLLAAALLHDVGKSCYTLSLWERVLIVLAKAVFPNRIEEWGTLTMSESQAHPDGGQSGWKRAFVIAEQHPRWGAELAAGAGCSALTVSLIRRHQEPLPSRPDTIEDRLLSRLQSADGSF
jgi:hypothetical protein